MKFKTVFIEFCDNKGYTGQYFYNEITEEYHIVISKGDNNAGAFLKPLEYLELDKDGLNKILDLLDKGFKQKFS